MLLHHFARTIDQPGDDALTLKTSRGHIRLHGDRRVLERALAHVHLLHGDIAHGVATADPDPQDPYFQQFPGKFRAELHNRLTSPLNALLFAVLPLVFLGQAETTRQQRSAATTLAGSAAFKEAGLGPSDLDVVELQDTDAARELLSYEELGLCPAGDAAKLLEEGATRMGGRLPVNPSGGLLSKGEPLGASALGQVVELTRQLRGDAGPRQVDGARVALGHTVGRGANASVVILKR